MVEWGGTLLKHATEGFGASPEQYFPRGFSLCEALWAPHLFVTRLGIHAHAADFGDPRERWKLRVPTLDRWRCRDLALWGVLRGPVWLCGSEWVPAFSDRRAGIL